jgi:oligopeptide transport system substrate-binding protein
LKRYFARSLPLAVVFLVAMLVVVACSSDGSVAEPSVSPETTASPTSPPVSTAGPTGTPRPTTVATPFPTITPTPAATTRPQATATPEATATAQPTATPEARALAETSPYENETFGFSISYPTEWTSGEGNLALGEVVFFAQDEGGIERLLVDVIFNGGTGTLEEEVDSILEGLATVVDGLQVLSKEAVQLPDGTDAFEAVIDLPSDSLPLRGKMLLARRGSQLFQAYVETVRGAFDDRLPELGRLLESFRLGEAAPFGVTRTDSFVTFDAGLSSLDPQLIGDATSARYAAQIFGGLVALDRNLEIVPDLAERWEISPDGKVYTFHIREDARFHSGKPVTAEDVRYTIDRAGDPATGSDVAGIYLNDIVGFNERLAGEVDNVSGVEIIDELTIRITITQPVPYFLAKLSHTTGSIVNRDNVEGGNDLWFLDPDGTGPFSMKGWDPGVVMVLERNERYHLDPPKLSHVTIWNVGDPLAMYEADELDAFEIAGGTAASQDMLDASHPLNSELQVGPQLGINIIGFNQAQAPFEDPRARRAFALATDREALIEEFFIDTVELASGYLPLGMPGFDAGLRPIPHDPVAAKALWDQVVVDSGIETETFNFLVTGLTLSAFDNRLAEMWQDALGITIEFSGTAFGLNNDALVQAEANFFEYGWIADYPDPQNFADVLFHSEAINNIGGYSNAEIDGLLEAARVDQDRSSRIQRYSDADRVMLDDVPAIPLYYFRNYVLVKPHVQNWFFSQQGVPDYTQVELTRAVAV